MLRAEWAKLDTPIRMQDLAQRHLPLRLIDRHQFDQLKHLPERPPDLVPPDSPDPIGNLLESRETPTASIPAPGRAR